MEHLWWLLLNCLERKISATLQGTNFFIDIWPLFLLIQVFFAKCSCFLQISNKDETF